jgi:hypothetical protein
MEGKIKAPTAVWRMWLGRWRNSKRDQHPLLALPANR